MSAADTVSTVREFLRDRTLCKFVGDVNEACTVASINLALGNPLSDDCPECMPPTIHAWAIVVQDAAPAWMRNSPEWKEAAALSCGADLSGAAERKRVALITDWMWSRLATLQAAADAGGFGDEWRNMLRERTHQAARAAEAAAWAAVGIKEHFWRNADCPGLLRKLAQVTA